MLSWPPPPPRRTVSELAVRRCCQAGTTAPRNCQDVLSALIDQWPMLGGSSFPHCSVLCLLVARSCDSLSVRLWSPHRLLLVPTYTSFPSSQVPNFLFTDLPSDSKSRLATSWFPCDTWFPYAYKRMLRRFPRFQVATACFSCSTPDLNLLDPYFIFMYMHNNHCYWATAHLQSNILLLLLLLLLFRMMNGINSVNREILVK